MSYHCQTGSLIWSAALMLPRKATGFVRCMQMQILLGGDDQNFFPIGHQCVIQLRQCLAACFCGARTNYALRMPSHYQQIYKHFRTTIHAVIVFMGFVMRR